MLRIFSEGFIGRSLYAARRSPTVLPLSRDLIILRAARARVAKLKSFRPSSRIVTDGIQEWTAKDGKLAPRQGPVPVNVYELTVT